MEELFSKLNIKPKDMKLYNTAFSHSSYANEHKAKGDYEKLEFLGDSVVDLVIADYLYSHNSESEGEMTKIRASYVCENALYEYSIRLGLNEFLLLGNGELERDGKHNRAIVADIFESFIGAMFLDLGIEQVKSFIYKHVIPLIENKSLDFVNDYKSVLQELVQTDKKSLEYVIVNETGPAHEKEFSVVVKIDDIVYGSGTAHSKKEAEQQAAKDALQKAQDGTSL